MKLSAPIVFEPLFKERVWGGRRMATLLGKRLPQSMRVGESWEIVDRPEAQSVVHEGPLRGATLHELWTEHREAIFGRNMPEAERFPLLCKILDAQDRLSLQVHPPDGVAERFNGEPKTEMWYILDALLDSDLYAGVKAGVTEESFKAALAAGRVSDLVHKLPVRKGDAVFIPSGRVHAIGAGNLVVEVQQNSDTTYRVFDWNRMGTDGLPRELHVKASLASIDFADVEPRMAEVRPEGLLAEAKDFRVEKWTLEAPRQAENGERFAIFTVVEGRLACGEREFKPGDFFLVPPVVAFGELRPREGTAVVLRTMIPEG